MDIIVLVGTIAAYILISIIGRKNKYKHEHNEKEPKQVEKNDSFLDKQLEQEIQTKTPLNVKIENGKNDFVLQEAEHKRNISPSLEKAAISSKKKQYVTYERKKKDDWREFERIVREHGNVKLYHFTDKRNIPSTQEHGGLYSWHTLEKKKINVVGPGGNSLSRRLDTSRNLQDYVRLCFHPNQPMKYIAKKDGRIGECMILEIDPEVIYWEDTLFSNENAAATSANIGASIKDFENIRFDILNRGIWNGQEEKRYFQAEVLVKTHVPYECILSIKPEEYLH